MTPAFKKKLEKISKLPLAIQPIFFAAFLAKLFKEKNVTLTVVGGAAVQFYTQAEYTTGDLDAILQGDTKEIIEEIMGSLGFERTSMYRHFENPLFEFVVEFPPSPIGIGNRVISDVANIQTEEGTVRVTRLEDTIMDRIIAAVEWKDQPSLDQAKLMWMKNKNQIDKKYLTEFAKSEGYLKTLQDIMKL
jgi:predicted nucleotidyltransferase